MREYIGNNEERILFFFYKKMLFNEMNIPLDDVDSYMKNLESKCFLKALQNLIKPNEKGKVFVIRNDKGDKERGEETYQISRHGIEHIESKYRIPKDVACGAKISYIDWYEKIMPKYMIVSNDIIVEENYKEEMQILEELTWNTEKWIQENIEVDIPHMLRSRIIFSENYLKTRKKISKEDRKKTGIPNGEYIQPENVTNGVATIIINVPKILNDKELNAVNTMDKACIGGVIVHEILHCYDIETLLCKLKKEVSEVDVDDLCKIFFLYSEMRSKYYQELYVAKNYCNGGYERYVSENLQEYERNDIYRKVNLTGQLTCWIDNSHKLTHETIERINGMKENIIGKSLLRTISGKIKGKFNYEVFKECELENRL